MLLYIHIANKNRGSRIIFKHIFVFVGFFSVYVIDLQKVRLQNIVKIKNREKRNKQIRQISLYLQVHHQYTAYHPISPSIHHYTIIPHLFIQGVCKRLNRLCVNPIASKIVEKVCLMYELICMPWKWININSFLTSVRICLYKTPTWHYLCQPHDLLSKCRTWIIFGNLHLTPHLVVCSLSIWLTFHHR